ncbi:MAG: tetratricopeptide repeat protein [Candidatus Limnocylindrales bacterium]
MTATTDPAEPVGAPSRQADLALARMHLRLGLLAIAQTELEMLAGAGELDGPGRVDLAEVRWRSGDLVRAGDAATEALTVMGDDPVALVIAAESAAALGRPNEARRLAMRAMDCIGGPVDAIFAGMPRSAVWPADAAEPPPTTATLFQQDPIAAPARRAGDSDSLVTSTLRAPAGEPATSASPSRPAVTPGFWDVDGGVEPVAPGLPDPAEELDAAARALAPGALDEAALRFALTLRLAPALAPAVLEATDGILGAGGAAGSGAAGPALSVVRGDAFRLVGLEMEARRAFAMAAWSGARDRRRAAAREPEAPAVSDTIPPVQRTRSRAPRTHTPR